MGVRSAPVPLFPIHTPIIMIVKRITDYLHSHAVAFCLLLFSLFQLWLLLPLLADGFPFGGDNASHYIYSVQLAEMMRAGNFRFWLPDFSMGQPLLFYYQPIPHLVTAFIYLLFPFAEPVLILKLLMIFFMVLIPISIYQGMRWMGFSKSMCLIGVIVACSIRSWKGFGYEPNALLKWGFYTQLWGMALAPLVIGYIYKTFYGNRKLFIPVTILGLLLLTHVVTGLITCMAIAMLFFVSEWTVARKWKDTLYFTKLYIGAFCIAAVLLVPTFLYGDYISGFFSLSKPHHLGIGLMTAIEKFYTGQIFDINYLPVMTICVVGSLGLALYTCWAGRNQPTAKGEINRLKFLIINFALALFLVSGAKTFTFLQYTPLYNNLPFLRLISLWHLVSIPLIAFGIAKIWSLSKKEYSSSLLTNFNKYSSILVVFSLLLYIGYRQYDTMSKRVKTHNYFTDSSANKAYEEAIYYLKSQPHGRLHTSGVTKSVEKYLPSLIADKPISNFRAAGSRISLGKFYLHNINPKEPTHYEVLGYPYLLMKKGKGKKVSGKSLYENNKYEVFKTSASNSYFDVVQSNTVTLTHNQPARYLLLNWMNTPELIRNKQHIAIGEGRSRDYFEQLGFTQFINLEQPDKRFVAELVELENTLTNEKIKTKISKRGKGISAYLAQDFDDLEEKHFGQVLEEHHEEGYYKAKIEVLPNETNTPQWAMLKVNAHPDWKARVNGKPAEWIQMSPSFMAVRLEPGVHEVEFEFGVSTLRISLLLLSFLIITGLGVWERVLPRKKRFPVSQLVTSK